MADLRVTGRSRREMGEDVDPAVGLINLADIMLVFATGLMMALVTYWNVEINPSLTEVVDSSMVTEVSNLEEAKEFLESGGSSYSEIGTVYKDPETGTLYMLTEDVEGHGAGVPDEGTDEGASAEGTEGTGATGESTTESEGGTSESSATE